MRLDELHMLAPRQWAWLLYGLLMAALAFSLWRWLELLVPAEADIHLPPPRAAVEAASPRAAATTSLAELHLFGIHDDKAGGALPPESELELSLQGTLMATDRSLRRAFIAQGDGSQASYAENDRLPGGARLLEIARDHVIVSRNGVRETLRMARARTAAAAGPAGAAPVAGYRGGPLKQAPPIPGVRGTGTPGVNVQNAQLAMADLKLDPEQIARQVNALPVRRNGKLVGYRLRAGRYAGVLQRLGVRPQDIITAINGQPLNDPAAALMLMHGLQQSGPVELTVERDGRPATVTIDLDS